MGRDSCRHVRVGLGRPPVHGRLDGLQGLPERVPACHDDPRGGAVGGGSPVVAPYVAPQIPTVGGQVEGIALAAMKTDQERLAWQRNRDI